MHLLWFILTHSAGRYLITALDDRAVSFYAQQQVLNVFGEIAANLYLPQQNKQKTAAYVD